VSCKRLPAATTSSALSKRESVWGTLGVTLTATACAEATVAHALGQADEGCRDFCSATILDEATRRHGVR
jgi:hypothetical protein